MVGALGAWHWWGKPRVKSGGLAEVELGLETQPVVKQVDQIVNDSDAVQDDDELVFDVAAGERWAFRFFLRVVGTIASDFKAGLVVPSGATGSYWRAVAFSTGALIYEAAVEDENAYLLTSSAEHGVLLEGWVLADSTGGQVQLRWAQNTAVAEDTTVLAGSFVVAERLEP